MGIFDKIKNTAFDPAVLGGPSNRAVSADDPIWAPINGVSLEDYADLARTARDRGVTDEAGMIALHARRSAASERVHDTAMLARARERGWDPAGTKAALDGWVQRMGQSMAVGQRFRKLLGY